MPNYQVRIDLNSISYEVEADNEEQAVDMASDMVYDESMYDLLKWADYDVEEIKS